MTQPVPTPAPVAAPAAPVAAPVAAGPSKVSIATKALVAAATSKQGVKLELALARYVVYAVLGAEGVKHAHFLGF